jgi:hypothetical protein
VVRQTAIHEGLTPINVIAKKQVASRFGVSPNLEKLHKVVVLSVHVPTYCEGSQPVMNRGE